ncbi:MAG: VanZ family protein [Clostridiales bacterium]|nr:VanZ family protein [Clostridiales bacterium]
MKTLLRFLLKPLAFVPALLMIFIIFNFSQQPGDVSADLSLKISRKVVTTVDYVFEQNWSDAQINQYVDKIHFYVRKAGHITEYFILAITITLPLYVVFGLRHAILFIVSGIICVLLACGDEYHQTFISGRTGTPKDVLIDSIGIFSGILVSEVFCFVGRKTIFAPLEKR